jgi:hypothetical protein
MKNINSGERIFLIVFFILLFLGVFLSHYNLEVFEGFYVVEDGLIEWLTVIFLIWGGILSMRRVYLLKGKKPSLFVFATFFLGLLFFFGAGEEISWGQRIFNIEAGDFFQRHNSQHETNLHNLVVNGVKLNKLIFGLFLGIGIAFYLLILPLLYGKIEKIKLLVDKLALPIPRIYQISCYIILALSSLIVASPKKGELLEFGGCFLFFLIIWRPLNEDMYRIKK